MSVLYSHLKFVGFPSHIKAFTEKTLAPPVHVRLKPMNHCNHDCWYCAYRISNLELGENIDLKDRIPEDKLLEIVDDLVEIGVRAVTFSGGGEPLLHKAIPAAVQKLAEGGVKVGCLTNGSNLKGKVAEAFLRYGTWVRISTDGWSDESFSRIRNIQGDEFSRIVANISNFASQNSNCTIGISLIVTGENYEHVFEICQIFKNAGVNHVAISGVVTSNAGEDNNKYHMNIRKDVNNQIDKAMGLVESGFSIINRYHELTSRFDKNYTQCPTIQFTPVIGADCKVYTCHDKAYTDSGLLGSIANKRFKDFWFSEENRVKVFGLNPSQVCGHHCIAHYKNLMIKEYSELENDHSVFV